jgi:hypothetical protein
MQSNCEKTSPLDDSESAADTSMLSSADELPTVETALLESALTP